MNLIFSIVIMSFMCNVQLVEYTITNLLGNAKDNLNAKQNIFLYFVGTIVKPCVSSCYALFCDNNVLKAEFK